MGTYGPWVVTGGVGVWGILFGPLGARVKAQGIARA